MIWAQLSPAESCWSMVTLAEAVFRVLDRVMCSRIWARAEGCGRIRRVPTNTKVPDSLPRGELFAGWVADRTADHLARTVSDHTVPSALVSFRNGEIVDPPGSRAARSASSSGRRHRLGDAGTHEEAVFPWLEGIVQGELVDSDA
jgi:hypothetical protein